MPSASTSEAEPRFGRLGVGFGLLGAASIALFGPIGVSTTYPRAVGAMLERLFPSFAASQPYLVQIGGLVRPETAIVLGLVIGGLLASRLSGERAPGVELVHAHERSRALRYLTAFIGGFLLLFGARLAGGCTSGHVISGIMQLSVSGLIFGAGVFATGIPTAKLLQKGR
ncbi:MAG TPA: YeeE/YedE thiosulfate transporter family protein [Pantanalinema sp.]